MTVTRRLDEVCLITMGQAPNGMSYNDKGTGWPLIAGAGDFEGIRPAPKKYTTEASKLTETGDIVLGIRASIGAKVLADDVYCLGRGVAALRPLPELDRRFLWNWLTYSAPLLASKGKGATFKQVNRKDIGELPIWVPPLPVQRRIADVLDRVDNLHAQRRSALALIDGLATAVFAEMFLLSDSVPTVRLGDCISFVTSGGRGWAQYYAPTGSRFIRSLDVRMNYIEGTNPVYVCPPESAEAKRTRVEPNDVLLTITGSLIGRVSAVPTDLSGSFISQHVAILRPMLDKIEPRFLAFFLSLPAGGQRQIAKMQYGQTKPGLNFQQIRQFEIPLPRRSVQSQFVERLATIEGIAQTHLRHLGELDALFAAVQYRAFRGELWDDPPE